MVGTVGPAVWPSDSGRQTLVRFFLQISVGNFKKK